jgi:hypothetical protein
MSIVRKLLDQLDRDALVRLRHLRGLPGGNNNEERRETLARSYRGDVEELIRQLEYNDLIAIFNRMCFEIDGERMYLPEPENYEVEDLRRFARKAFAGARLCGPSPFQFEDDEDEYEDDEDEEEEEDEEEDDDEDEEENEDDEEELLQHYTDEDDESDMKEKDAEETLPRALQAIGPGWSRPRAIPALLRDLGESVPSRLRTTRFRALLASLLEVGIEACLADDDEYMPLDQDAESPGIAAKLRLRRRQEPEGQQANRHLPLAPAMEPEPTRVIVVPEQPVAQRAPRPSDYQLAVLRLQFLTAVPSVERRTMPTWPKGYLDAATRGLSLRPRELAFLVALSNRLCMGNHSPVDAISHLETALTQDEWDRLIADFRALNPFQLELVSVITEQVSQFGSWPGRGSWQNIPAASNPTEAPSVVRSSPTFPSAPGGTNPSSESTVVRTEKPESRNVRSLGALDDMFDKE